jgi:hypothetical protein
MVPTRPLIPFSSDVHGLDDLPRCTGSQPERLTHTRPGDEKRAISLSPVPSRRSTLLPSAAEEEPPGDAQEVALREKGRAAPAESVLDIPLSKLRAFGALPSQLQTLTQEITSSLTLDLVSVLKTDLGEGRSSSDDHTDLADRLRPLIQGLVRTGNLRESVTAWRDVVLEEVQGIMQQVRIWQLPRLGEQLNRLRVAACTFI